MSKKLSLSIAINLLTENFKKGASAVKSQLKSIQMQVVTFAAALGVGGLGLMGLVSRMKDVARETSRALTALKNVSGGTALLADNLRFLNNLAKQYGIEINTLTMNYAKFKAAGDSVGMTIKDQRKIFEATSRAAVAYGMSAEDTNLTFLAITQMMSKGKISSEELRRQLGERLPIAMAAMAKAAGVPINKLDDLLKRGKLMSAEVLPKFADALNEMIPNVNTDNLETSINRLQNAFTKFTQSSGVQEKYKVIIDGLTSLIEAAGKNIQNIVIGILAVIVFAVSNSLSKIYQNYVNNGKQIVANEETSSRKMRASVQAYTEAKKRLSDLELQYAQANAQKQITLARRVEEAKLQLQGRTAAARQAITARIAANEAAANVKTYGRLGTLGAMAVGTFKKIGAAAKSMLSSFGFGLLITAFTTLAYKIYELATATTKAQKAVVDFNTESALQEKELNGVFNAYKKANDGTKEKTQLLDIIKSKYGEYLKDLIDEKGNINDIEVAQRLANKALKESIALKIKNAAINEASTNEIKNQSETLLKLRDAIATTQGGDAANVLSAHVGSLFNDETKSPESALSEAISYLEDNGVNKNDKTFWGKAVSSLLYDLKYSSGRLKKERKDIEDSFRGIIGDLGNPIDVYLPDSNTDEPSSYGKLYKDAKKEWDDAKKELSAIEKDKDRFSKKQYEDAKTREKAAKDAFEALGGNDKGREREQNKAEKLAENKLESVRKLDEADKQRQIEKLSFDNDMRQRSIDNMNDGFKKEIEQLKLNYDKELQEIEEYKKQIAKAQIEELKNQYVSKHGNTKGFESYLKTVKLEDILPEGLKPSDVSKQVDQLFKAAKKSFEKGQSGINTEIVAAYKRQGLLFASSLDQQLADIDAHYKDEIRKATGDEELISRLQSNHLKERKLARIKYSQQLIELENGYKEKAIQIATDLFVFQSDKDAALLKQRMQNNETYISALKDEFKTLTGQDFDKLSDSELNQFFEKYPELTQAIKDAEQEQENLNNEVKKLPARKFNEVLGYAQQLISALSGTNEQLNQASSIISSIAQGASQGGWIGAAVAVVSNFIQTAVSNSEKRAAIARQILKLQDEYNISLRQQNYELISSIDYARAFRDNLEALHWLIEKGFISDTNYSVWDALNENFKEANKNILLAQKNLDKVESEVKNIFDEILKNSDLYGKIGGFKVWVQAINDWNNGLITTEEALRRAAATGMKGAQESLDRLNAANDEVDKYKDLLSELALQMDGFATGTSFDGFLDDAMSAITDMKSGVSDLADFTEKSLKDAILSSFKYKVLADALQPMYDRLSDIFLADELNEGAVNIWADDLEKLLVKYGDRLGDIFESLGLDFSDSSSTSQSSSKGYSVNTDQDTGGAILGRVTGLHETGLMMKEILSGISMNTTNIFSQNASMNNELKKQTGILDESRQIHIKSYFEIEDMNKTLKSFVSDASDKLNNIDKNTKRL